MLFSKEEKPIVANIFFLNFIITCMINNIFETSGYICFVHGVSQCSNLPNTT